jgi:hypothetical protein
MSQKPKPPSSDSEPQPRGPERVPLVDPDLLAWMKSLPKGTKFRVLLPEDEPKKPDPTRDS